MFEKTPIDEQQFVNQVRQREMAEQKRADYYAREDLMRGQAMMRPGAIMGAGAALGAEEVKRRSAGLEYQMERLAKTVASSEEVLSKLATRLTPFVRPLPIQEHEKGRAEYDSQSPLADQIARLADQLDRVNRGMTYLIDGVDV